MSRCWCVVSVAIVAVAVVPHAAAQQPGSAGATRPSLRVLQALPESQLFPLMNLVADSLGVRCDYCHVQRTPDLTRTPSNVGGWVWDSDDKPQKRVAREMMQMVVDLNAGRFKGESRVTCYTCHRGSRLPARTPPLPPAPGSATTPAALPLPSADRVWTSYVNAVGQVDTAARGTGTIISGWDDRPEGRYGKVEIVVAGTDRYRITLSTPDGTIVKQGLDGEVGWTATNDRVQKLSAADVARLRRIALRYRPVKERPANLQITGVERVADRDVCVATARIDPITTWTLYFDVVTGLLRREMTTTETMLLPLQEQVDYDDYRDVSGMQLPFRVQTSDGAPYGTVTRTFLQIQRNVAVDDALFRPPSGSR
jgi:Photosynthetic reaction centre cytochrome C subunit